MWEKAEFKKWMQEVQAKPAEAQLQAVGEKLKELNPEFDGMIPAGGNRVGNRPDYECEGLIRTSAGMPHSRWSFHAICMVSGRFRERISEARWREPRR